MPFVVHRKKDRLAVLDQASLLMARSAATDRSTARSPAIIMHRATNFVAGNVAAVINPVTIGILSSLLIFLLHSNLLRTAASAVIETETSSFDIVFS